MVSAKPRPQINWLRGIPRKVCVDDKCYAIGTRVQREHFYFSIAKIDVSFSDIGAMCGLRLYIKIKREK